MGPSSGSETAEGAQQRKAKLEEAEQEEMRRLRARVAELEHEREADRRMMEEREIKLLEKEVEQMHVDSALSDERARLEVTQRELLRAQQSKQGTVDPTCVEVELLDPPEGSTTSSQHSSKSLEGPEASEEVIADEKEEAIVDKKVQTDAKEDGQASEQQQKGDRQEPKEEKREEGEADLDKKEDIHTKGEKDIEDDRLIDKSEAAIKANQEEDQTLRTDAKKDSIENEEDATTESEGETTEEKKDTRTEEKQEKVEGAALPPVSIADAKSEGEVSVVALDAAAKGMAAAAGGTAPVGTLSGQEVDSSAAAAVTEVPAASASASSTALKKEVVVVEKEDKEQDGKKNDTRCDHTEKDQEPEMEGGEASDVAT